MNNKPNSETLPPVDVERFANVNIVPLERKEATDGKKKLHKTVCMDGRTEPEDSKGSVHLAGGDVGPLESIAATLDGKDNDPGNEKIVSAFIDTKKELFGEDAKLYLHTDEHGARDGVIGCGHANRMSSDNPEYNGDGKYGLTSDRAKDLFEKAWARPEAEHLVLKGDHKEKAVLFVHGEEKGKTPHFSINPFDKKSGESFFVVDEEATEEYFRTLIPGISQRLGIELSVEEVLANYSKQLGITAGLLAGDLEKYDAFIDEEGKLKELNPRSN